MTPTARTTITVIGAVLMWVGAALAQSCPGDFNFDHQVTVDEIIGSVNNALNGCPPTWLLGRYTGQDWDYRSCPDPADNGIDAATLVLDISAQDGLSFSGKLTGTDSGGDVGEGTITGAVSGTREISGEYTAPNESGTFSGTVAGDTCTVLTVTFSGEFSSGNGSCQSTLSFLVVRC